MDILTFEKNLLEAIVAYLPLCHNILSDEQIDAFDIGCVPWHGALELSFKTEKDKNIEDIEVAAWTHYAFNINRLPDDTIDHLAQCSAKAYETYLKKNVTADDYVMTLLLACARVANNSDVQDALRKLNVTENFKVTVYHSDKPYIGNLATINQ